MTGTLGGITDLPISLDDVLAAAEATASHVVRTPIVSGASLSNSFDLLLKAESLQTSRRIQSSGRSRRPPGLISQADGERGVITVSAGDHGIALSYAASISAPRRPWSCRKAPTQAKIIAIEELGGRPVLVDGTKLMDHMEEIQAREGFTFIHPFDHPAVMAGQGTVGLEIIQDLPHVDVAVVPVGGGGLILGIATAIKALKPEVRVPSASSPRVRMSFRAAGHWGRRRHLSTSPPWPMDSTPPGAGQTPSPYTADSWMR